MFTKNAKQFGISLAMAISFFSFSYALDNSIKMEYLNAVKHNNVSKVVNLVSEGLDVNVRDEKNGWTALHYAVYYGYYKTAKYLLENGALTEVRNKDGETPLHIAVKKGNIKLVKLLLEYGAETEVIDNKGKKPIDYAIDIGNRKLEILLSDEISEDEKLVKTLFSAVKKCNTKKTMETLKKVNVDIKDNEEKTPLFYAVENCSPKFIDVLLRKGANVNTTDKNDLSPLYYAIMNKDLEKVKLLVENGASITTDSPRDPSPLMVAVNLGALDIVKYLLSKGANPNHIAIIESFHGIYILTPLDIAQKKGYKNIYRILRKYGAKSQKEFTREEIKRILGQL
ncbi:MAG: hypothetical protein DSY60_05675 [Persephonella sp.]|nr:MAG: hypothetical protein DSY60_05675 [Persephonella sp.]